MGGGQTTEFLLVAVKFILFLNVFFGLIVPRRVVETVTAREYCDSLLSTFSTKTTFHTFSSDLQTIQQFLFGVDMSSSNLNAASSTSFNPSVPFLPHHRSKYQVFPEDVQIEADRLEHIYAHFQTPTPSITDIESWMDSLNFEYAPFSFLFRQN